MSIEVKGLSHEHVNGMTCPHERDIWIVEHNDPRWADHLASCAPCRAAAVEVERQRALLRSLPMQEAPAAVAEGLRTLSQAVTGHALSCDETLALLDDYRENALATSRVFLVEEHLLWCEACAAALEQDEAILAALRTLPELTPPDAIAERIAAARLPWWQRWWSAPAPSWHPGRLFQVSGAVAVVALAFALLIARPPAPPVANNHHNRTSHTHSVVPDRPALGPERPAVSTAPATLPGPDMIAMAPADTHFAPVISGGTSAPGAVDVVDLPNSVPVAYQPPQPSSKADFVLAGMSSGLTPSRAIAPRPTVVEPPVQPDMLRGPVASADPIRIKADERKDESEYDATAREALMSLHRDAELAACDDALSAVPETVRLAVATVRPQPAHAAVYTPPADHTDELNRALSRDLQRAPAMTPSPVTVRSDRTGKRDDGVLFTIH